MLFPYQHQLALWFFLNTRTIFCEVWSIAQKSKTQFASKFAVLHGFQREDFAPKYAHYSVVATQHNLTWIYLLKNKRHLLFCHCYSKGLASKIETAAFKDILLDLFVVVDIVLVTVWILLSFCSKYISIHILLAYFWAVLLSISLTKDYHY